MPSTPYMKLYISDYLGDTQHLSTLEHGAYILLIMAYWQNCGPLKNDPKLLRRLTRTTPKEFQKVSENVLKMFQVTDGLIVHKRIDLELSKREQVSTAARNAADARWSGRNAGAMPAQCESNTTPIVHSPESIEYKNNIRESRFAPPSLEEVQDYCKARKNTIDAQAFIDFYSSKDWMIGKNKMKNWRAAIGTWERRNRPIISPTIKPSPPQEVLGPDFMQEVVAKHRRELEANGHR